MTDLEMTRLCAEAVGLKALDQDFGNAGLMVEHRTSATGTSRSMFNPLVDDAQAMALVKKLRLWIGRDVEGWVVTFEDGINACGMGPDLNRAIVECVAKMHNAG